MQTVTIQARTIGPWTIRIEAADLEMGSPLFSELYTASEHIGGVTIQNPDGQGFYIGQTTPAQLAKEYAKQGHSNPCKTAYASLQRELEHYIKASDCVLRCTVERGGYELAQTYGIGFELSDVYGDTLGSRGRLMLKDYGREFVHEAMQKARTVLAKIINGGVNL